MQMDKASKLLSIHMKIKAEFDVSMVFASEEYSIKNESGHQLLEVKFKDKRVSEDLREAFQEERMIEAQLNAYSILQNKKFKILEHKEIVETDLGSSREILWGKNIYGEELINQNEWIDENGNIFWNIDAAQKDFPTFSKNLSILVETEPILRFVLRKFNESYFEQGHEFFYLFDIKEGIKKYFHETGIRKYVQELGLSMNEIGEFSHTLNNKPLFQSRHPGSFVNEMKTADGEMIRGLRKTARKMILALISYMLKKNGMISYGNQN